MTSFAELHRPGDPLLLPNAWDVASAAALIDAGFAAIGTTSLGVAAAAGKRDASDDAWPETKALAQQLARLPAHITVDFEHGFSEDPDEVAEHAAQLHGIAGINLEDRYQDARHHASVIAAVKRRVPDLFVNARTDTHWLREGDLDEAIERCRRYVAAGADGVFVPGVSDPHEIAALASAVEVPLNVLFTPGGLTVAQLAERGVARISTGSLLYRAALGAAVDAATRIRGGETLKDLRAPDYKTVDALAGPR